MPHGFGLSIFGKGTNDCMFLSAERRKWRYDNRHEQVEITEIDVSVFESTTASQLPVGGNMLVPYAVGSLFTIILAMALVRAIGYLYATWTRWSRTKLKLIRNEPLHVQLLAGEISPAFYRRFSEIFRERPNLRAEILAGPWMLVDDVDYEACFDSKTGGIREPDLLWKAHPLFRLKAEFPDRLQVFIKHISSPDEHHFGIGVTTGEVFIEHPHGRGPFIGGYWYPDRHDVYAEKQREFEMMREDPAACTELRLDNVEKILSLPDVTFCRVSDRPRETRRVAS